MIGKLYYKLVGYKSRRNYWSSGKVADFLRNVFGIREKPFAATASEWNRWQKQCEKEHPVGCWIVEEGLDMIQDFMYFPYDVIRHIKIKFKNRFVTKSFLINTKLSRYEWHECEEQLLHGMCEVLVDFVECQKAHMNDLRAKHDKYVPKIKDRRKAGLAYLDWEICLGDESPYQSKAAEEIKEIYLWWKDVRPYRKDSHDLSGWTEYCDARRDRGFFLEEKNDEERAMVRELLAKAEDIEDKYEQEDTEMLKRIVDVRKSLWT